jgi:hypothetical protein
MNNRILLKLGDETIVLWVGSLYVTPWSRVLLDNLTVTQLVQKNASPFMESEGSLNVFTWAHHGFLS